MNTWFLSKFAKTTLTKPAVQMTPNPFQIKLIRLLVRLEFKLKLEPLLLYSPFLLLLLLLLRFVKFFWLRLVLETWIFWFDLHLYLYFMVWLEIGRLAYTCARDLKLGTHLEGVHTIIFCQKNFLVPLALAPVHNGLTWNWTFTYIS